MSKRAAIVWFRRDLRLHDNEALTDAMKHADELLPVYIFDPREWRGTLPLTGLPKIGPHRAKFILESVADLRQNLRARGAELVVRTGHPEDILPELSKQCQASWVFCNRERTSEELRVQNLVEQNLWTIGREVYYSRGKLLYYTSDLPFPITQTPDTFSQFRKETERLTPVREPIPTPARVPLAENTGIDPGEIPGLEDFGIPEPPHDERAAIDWHGGETAGLDRLAYYLFGSQAISTYKETRNGLIGGDYSTKFSAWLALGCLSPKQVYAEIRAYEAKNGANDSTYAVIYELLWRDFFRLMGKKHGDKIFHKSGFREEGHPEWTKDQSLLKRWTEGQTGTPFVDANMREIARTGFMSNRGRQNVASYLVKDLKVDWRLGAEYFEHMLIDYDVTSNWCNWNYVAGVGSDPREDRYFNLLSQAERYDPQGEYVRRWCPELAALPAEYVHQPDALPANEQSDYGLDLGRNYPQPLVPSARYRDKPATKPTTGRRGRGRGGRRAIS
ncbi:deoxyribodipyrimidine photo-lyase [Lewinella marina]|uniref:Cryptochrome DASH n=1 Tax=Neolewinella marina TaxID=438751 RepID=A0A2G0CG90_9BACT|nr:DASH family cryptochrome [Neolewinella marina]NJB86570.1 deoxyribodipyrimidine photo-lyase [Neolewinella marina]PHK98978.1 cryptochrome DASH [Neolewinella marina]